LAQASRNTIRAALNQLRSEGLIKAEVGVGNRVVLRPTVDSAPTRVRTIGVLIPVPIGQLRPLIALWIDELRGMLIEDGYRLRIHAGRQYYQPRSTAALEKLVRQNGHEAWVLTLTSETMQRWFASRGVACVVAGSIYETSKLASVDIDYRASCRHAAGVLMRLGHRRLALLNHASRRAGEIESEQGFLEAVRKSSHGEATAEVVYHQDGVKAVTQAFHRLFSRAEFPTGLLVCNSYAYLTIASLLADRRLMVPKDVSLISRDDDPFLSSLYPEPARYVTSAHVFAKRLLASVLQLTQGEDVRQRCVRLMPKFTLGASTQKFRS
jgi:LacI family transcriptional regulator